MSTQFQLPLTSDESNISKMSSQSLANNAKLHHSLQTIMDLQQKLLTEKETNNTLLKEREDFVSMTESLSVQLQSAQTKIKIFNEETTLDKQKLDELNEHIQLQKETTDSAIDTLQTLSAHSKVTNAEIDNVRKYINELETLRNEVSQKNKKIQTLSHSLDIMTELKVQNDTLQSEITKLKKITNDDMSHKVIQKFEAENTELININAEISNERDQLMHQIQHISKQETINDNTLQLTDVIRANYDLKLNQRSRRCSIASVTSIGTPTVFTAEYDLENKYEFPYSVNVHDHDEKDVDTNDSKKDLFLNNVIGKYKTQLAQANAQKRRLSVQLQRMQNKARNSGSDMDDGYREYEEETKDYYDAYDIIHDEREYHKNEKMSVKNESDIDYDSECREVYSVCDYTTVCNTYRNENNEGEIVDSDMDAVELMIQNERVDCNVGGSTWLLQKMFAQISFFK